MRNGRKDDELRPVKITSGFCDYPDGSVLIETGKTRVLCNAMFEDRVPPHMFGGDRGWISAEYSMLPGSSPQRVQRDIGRLKLSPRTAEIQRLIGRSLRSAADLRRLCGLTLTVDCDVLQADGGTRTAAISGAYVALHLALQKMKFTEKWNELPLKSMVAAVSVGMVGGEPVLDLDFEEDMRAEVDANFVIDDKKRLIEVQATSEKTPMEQEEFMALMGLARKGIEEVMDAQKKALSIQS
jgi:ribonuclease PH